MAKIKISLLEYGSSYIIENATFIPEEDFDKLATYEVRNIHAELPIPEGKEKDPLYFATTSHAHALFGTSPLEIKEMRSFQSGLLEFATDWEKFKTAFNLFANSMTTNAESLLGKSKSQILLDADVWMSKFLRGSWERNFSNIELMLTQAASKQEFSPFKNKMAIEFEDIIHEIFNGISCYMDARTHFDKVIFFQKRSIRISPETRINSSWEDVKHVYGDLYEIIGNMMHIVACINNINSGRGYDEFSSPGFTLEKYKESDKANRCINFSGNPNYDFIKNAYLPWLRNGTHHQRTRFYPGSEFIDFSVGKGGKTIKRVKLYEYTAISNDLFAVLLILAKLYIKICESHE